MSNAETVTTAVELPSQEPQADVAEKVIPDAQEEQAEIFESKWTFRPLKASDLFPLARLISKIGINQFANAFEGEAVQSVLSRISGEEQEDNSAMLAGAALITEIIQIVLVNLDKCEEEMYSILAATSDLCIAQVKDLDLDDFLAMVVEFVRKDEFARFFKRASALLK